MELVSFAKEILQNVAEEAASYRFGQAVLRQCDRALWVVEKTARWAVPPPLNQDERPQPELIRPLPWIFFLPLLLALRITRESMSLLNLFLGKPPLRSADVVMYIQSKRRYLRTLKYQGNRILRARTSSTQPRESWLASLQSLFDFTMCFRRNMHNYGNNNTTQISNNDEILVIKHDGSTQDDVSPIPSTSETSMERLIEKMMVDLDADSDDDNSYTLTNITNAKNDQLEPGSTSASTEGEITFFEQSTPSAANEVPFPESRKSDLVVSGISNDPNQTATENESAASTPAKRAPNKSDIAHSTPETAETAIDSPKEALTREDEAISQPTENKTISTKEESEKFIDSETYSSKRAQQSPKRDQKIANGRTVKNIPNKRKAPGGRSERHEPDVPVVRITPAGDTLRREKGSNRQSHQNDQ